MSNQKLMQVSFLKVSPKLAVETLRGCILSGSELRESLLDEYYNKKRGGDMLGIWAKNIENWSKKSLIKLGKIYSSPVEPIMFRNSRAESYHIGMVPEFGDRIIKLEGKIKVLNDMYRFILNNSNITINAKGDVIFQAGDKNVAHQNG